MMYVIYLLIGISVICGLLCAAELIVRVWEKADRRARTMHSGVCIPAVQNAAPLYAVGSLPDRDAVKNIYSLSDQFADRFREVVNS